MPNLASPWLRSNRRASPGSIDYNRVLLHPPPTLHQLGSASEIHLAMCLLQSTSWVLNEHTSRPLGSMVLCTILGSRTTSPRRLVEDRTWERILTHQWLARSVFALPRVPGSTRLPQGIPWTDRLQQGTPPSSSYSAPARFGIRNPPSCVSITEHQLGTQQPHR